MSIRLMSSALQICQSCKREFLSKESSFFICEECRSFDNRHKKSTENCKKRKSNIPDSIRWEVLERDNFTCRQCGTRKYLSVDHIIPEYAGGTLELSNLQTLCRSCNSRKGTK